jgi:hypothetical protein
MIFVCYFSKLKKYINYQQHLNKLVQIFPLDSFLNEFNFHLIFFLIDRLNTFTLDRIINL